MSKIEAPESIKEMPLVVIRNMIALSTSGFGVVVGLAWNEVVQNAVKTYVDPYLGKGSGMISLLIYATIMTLLAVLFTMQLTNLEKKFTSIQEKMGSKKKDC